MKRSGLLVGISILSPEKVLKKAVIQVFFRTIKGTKPAAYGIRNPRFVMKASFCRECSLHWHKSP